MVLHRRSLHCAAHCHLLQMCSGSSSFRILVSLFLGETFKRKVKEMNNITF